jgi:hypothetical protein
MASYAVETRLSNTFFRHFFKRDFVQDYAEMCYGAGGGKKSPEAMTPGLSERSLTIP